MAQAATAERKPREPILCFKCGANAEDSPDRLVVVPLKSIESTVHLKAENLDLKARIAKLEALLPPPPPPPPPKPQDNSLEEHLAKLPTIEEGMERRRREAEEAHARRMEHADRVLDNPAPRRQASVRLGGKAQ